MVLANSAWRYRIATRLPGLLLLCLLLAACSRGGDDKQTSQRGTSPKLLSAPSLPSASAVFPLRVEPGKRYLIDATGKPFLLQGDAGWELIAKLTREDADRYLEDRRLKGFNAVIVRLIDHDFVPVPPRNAYGDSPFKERGDFGTPNGSYFAHVDWVLSKAAEKGFLVLLAPAYTGYHGGGQGWYQEMERNGANRLRAYGQYVGNRYEVFTNVLWVNGGDFNPPNSGKDLVRAVANGIRDVDVRAMQTFHGGRFTAALGYWDTSERWLTLNNIYTDQSTVVSMALREYARSQVPFILIEARYEDEGADARLVRTQAYQAMLSGAAGYIMGNKLIWGFFPGWRSALNSDGARSLVHLRKLFEERAWWTLEPDMTETLLTSGTGAAADRAVAARAADHSFAIAYVPTVRMVTIDLSQLSGPRVQAQWCDPHNGICVAISGSPFATTGPQTFLPAGANSGGFGDWVLVLDSTQ
jgi:hypothetical protein